MRQILLWWLACAGHTFYIDLHGREYVAADVLPLH